MNFIDYQKKLGLGFDDNRKVLQFYAQIHNYLDECSLVRFDRYEERAFCDMIGEYVRENQDNFSSQKSVYGLQRAWMYLERHQGYFTDFLSCCIALINSLTIDKNLQIAVKSKVLSSLDNCHILYDFITDDDGIFIFPKGAKELDDALVSEPLEWLKDYPNSHKAFVKALKTYSDASNDNASDIADLFRKSLETFFQEFFDKTQSLENLKKIYGEYLRKHSVPGEISNNFETLLQSYTNYINNYAKHHDNVSKNVLEYIMYQTGNIIRLLIKLKEDDKNSD